MNELKEEFKQVQGWLAGYCDAVSVYDTEQREGAIAVYEALKELPQAFYNRFILPLEK